MRVIYIYTQCRDIDLSAEFGIRVLDGPKAYDILGGVGRERICNYSITSFDLPSAQVVSTLQAFAECLRRRNRE